jgi:PEP-CTERM motif
MHCFVESRAKQARVAKTSMVAAAVALMLAAASAQAQVAKPYFEFKKPALTQIPNDISTDNNGFAAPVMNAGSVYKLGFEAISQYDNATLLRNFIPPDTLGAVGRTQYMATTNGAYAVFDKDTGARTSLVADTAFWASAGQAGANGDTRVMYNADASRWVVISFGSSVSDIQIAVSDTDNALGTWKSTKFTGYSGLGFGGTADYPTLAMDKNALYIGTNNFAPATSGGANSFRGTTLNVIPMASVFNATAPTTTGLKQFETVYSGTSTTNVDRGFAQQGVNSNSTTGPGKVVASSLFNADNIGFTVNGLTSTSATASTLGAVTYTGQSNFNTPVPARQPSVAIPANQAIIAAGDERTSSSVYEVNGRIYAVTTVDPVGGAAENRIRVSILDSNTFALLSETDIGDAGYDYYQGSIGINAAGKVVVAYNRSGLDVATGKISFMARTFDTTAAGGLLATGSELLLKESLTDDYHNGSIFGQASVGRQRWGDYSSVSVDPTNDNQFYVMGEFAREYNNAAGGHPGGSGGSRWSTWVAVLDVSAIAAVPEPSTYLLMALGLVATGFAARRRQA